MSKAAVLQMHTTIMADITKILETVIVDNVDIDNDNDDIIQEYYLSEIIKKFNIPFTNIIRWEYQIARFIHRLHLKQLYISSINLDELMINKDLNIIGDTLIINTWKGHQVPEVIAINSIINMHKCIYEYISKLYTNKEQHNKFKLLYSISNYYFIASIKCHSATSVLDLVKCIENLLLMVEVGFIDNIYATYNVNKK